MADGSGNQELAGISEGRESLRVLELVAVAVSLAFAASGVRIFLYMNLGNVVMANLLRQVAESTFIVFFGAAGAVLCFRRIESMANYFGFLTTWSGRGVFFLTMGFYMYPSFCQYGCLGCREDCWDRGGQWTQIGSIASLVSVVLGTVILILRCTWITESGGGDVWGQPKHLGLLEFAGAVASFGMVLLGFRMLMDANLDGPVWNLTWYLSLTFIINVFAFSSLLASLRSSGFVCTFLGFLDHGWQRGVFYMLMGFYTFALFYEAHQDLWSLICYGCSTVSVVAGIVIIATFSLSRPHSPLP